MTYKEIQKYKTIILKEDWSEDLQKGTECVIVECSPYGISVRPVEDNSRSLPIPVPIIDVLPGQLREKLATSSNRATNIKKGDKGTLRWNTDPMKQGDECIVLENTEKMDDSIDALRLKSTTSSKTAHVCSNVFIPNDTKEKETASPKIPVYTHIVINTTSEYTSLQTSLKNAKEYAKKLHPSDFKDIVVFKLTPVLTINQTTTFKKVK